SPQLLEIQGVAGIASIRPIRSGAILVFGRQRSARHVGLVSGARLGEASEQGGCMVVDVPEELGMPLVRAD
ncbi:hypothetical protein, partial [Gordonia paraffinivorans]|uniref:hypothetical protein n=1 Tax=Gordonia paraffinivorans TaxID=175628 RepID=UPI00242F4D25